jgi:hypothetical protein
MALPPRPRGNAPRVSRGAWGQNKEWSQLLWVSIILIIIIECVTLAAEHTLWDMSADANTPEALKALTDATVREPIGAVPEHTKPVLGDPSKVTNAFGFPDDEFELITVLAKEVADVPAPPKWHTPEMYHRFIVARKGKVDLAAEMYRKAMAWRVENKIEELVFTYREPDVVKQYFPTGFVGFDSDGYPVLVERIGLADLAGLEATLGGDAFLEWVAYYHEVQERAMELATKLATAREGKPTLRNKLSVIVDLSGLGMHHVSSATLGVLQRRTGLEEANYPEVVNKVSIIRAPTIFAGVWSIVRNFVDPGTRAKMSLTSSGYLEVLREYIPDSAIPAFLGGAFGADTDVDCARSIGLGGIIPDPFYMSVDGKAESVTLHAGKITSARWKLPARATMCIDWSTMPHPHAVHSAAARLTMAGAPPATTAITVTSLASDAQELHGAAGRPHPRDTVQPLDSVTCDEAAFGFSSLPAPSTKSHAAERILVTSGSDEDEWVVLVWKSSAWFSDTKLLARCGVILPESASASASSSLSDTKE